MSRYRIAPAFVIRASGIPFEVVERLATRESAALARQIRIAQLELEEAGQRAEALLGSRESGLSADISRAARGVLRGSKPSSVGDARLPQELVHFAEIRENLFHLKTRLDLTLADEMERSRDSLFKSSLAVLPDYLVFGAGEFRKRLLELKVADTSAAAGPRNARVRERDRHLLLYLQRVCAKNDTFSRFGPSAWGRIDNADEAASFAPNEGIAERHIFLERWTAHHLAAALNQDPKVRPELAPRLNPTGRLEGATFVSDERGVTIPLTREMQEAIVLCDGETPAYRMDGAAAFLEHLASNGVIRWEVEVPAMEAHAFDVLTSDIAGWRDTSVRKEWLDRAQSIAKLPEHFAKERDTDARASIMAEAQGLLADFGGAREASGRSLYSAANPIAEECLRHGEFRISQRVADELTCDAAPWFDLWRDTYAFVASRVADSLRALFRTAPLHDGAISLAAFAQHCASNQLPLTGYGIVAPAHLAFQEIKAAFRNLMSPRSDMAECELTSRDCEFVRQNFSYQKFDEYTYPSADLQLSANSLEAIGQGDYQWIVSELHPPVAMLQHALYWSCPDKPALSRALASTLFERPGVHYGFRAADFTAHTTVEQMDALPDLQTFVAPERSNPRWRTIPPAEVEIFVEEETGDVAMRQLHSHEYLGSFARNWIIPLGFHPFHFGMAPHTPRLRCGNVIVQRRAWTVREDEIRPGNFTGISRDLVLAIEHLRADRDLPRYVYIRPTEQALRRSGAEGRDKDTKPVFIDLESYLSLEIFHRWLKKAGEIEVTEMLPDPDHLCWKEADGRRTFELRTLIVPRT